MSVQVCEEMKFRFSDETEDVCGTYVWFAPKPFDMNDDVHKRGVCIDGDDFIAYIDTRKGRKACPYHQERTNTNE